MTSRLAFAFALLSASIASASIDVQHFTASTDQPGTAWIGKALADGLSADLIDLRDAGNVRITGSYQTLNTQVRVNGQVLDGDGNLIGTMRVTGDTNDLFRLEDTLADIARKLVLRAIRQRAGATTSSSTFPIDPDRLPAPLAYSGPLRRNPRLSDEPKLTDPNARAATWRYYYSLPAYDWGCGYGYYGASSCYWRGYRGGRPGFIFAAYQGGWGAG